MDKRPYEYEFSPLAEQDLVEIFEYISTAESSSQTALKIIDDIQEAVEKVCELPFSMPLVKIKCWEAKATG
jgi:plasmid stabilization system protein ParE